MRILATLLFLAFATAPASAWDAGSFKKPTAVELKKRLTSEQYDVTQEEGTEPPFKNAFHDNHQDGIYVDVVSGEPLFSSKDKFDSGTGWPSFMQPLVKANIVERKDNKLFVTRTEVRSKHANSHLGHVFDDGPKPTGLRYCMNSASLRFIPAAKLADEGYSEFVPLFAKTEARSKLAHATFAGGCFWCMEPPFEKLPGVTAVISGYTGGKKANPTYEEVSSGTTGHIETVDVVYDPSKVSYEKLLDVFWHNVDPTDPDGQFVDRGDQYATAIYYHSEEQKQQAEASKAALEKSARFKKKIVTPIKPAGPFYAAEQYHQDYYKTNPVRYKYYRYRSGRDQFLEKTWGN